MNYDIVETIEIETNTICNSWCPICIRYTIRDGELWLNPMAKINQQLDIRLIEKVFSDPIISEYIDVDMIGTAGEPIAHPDFLEIVDIIYKHRPNARFNIHTNGGIRNTKFFTALGERLRNKPSRVCFSLDGLRDTNEIYRIGVNWDRAIDNLKAYIATGASATWQFVIFDWNKHQLEECKNYAFELGCKEFETRENVDPVGIDEAIHAAQNKINNEPAKIINKNMDTLPMADWDYIDDMCYSKKGVFLNPEGTIYPCCMFNAAEYDKVSKHFLNKAMYQTFGTGWNDLNTHSLTNIVGHQWWNWLYDSINNKPCDLCAQQCGAKRESKSRANISEVTYTN